MKTNYIKLLTIFAVFLASCSGTIRHYIDMPSLPLIFWRLTFALPFFLVPALVNRTKREKLFSANKHELLWSAIAGLFLVLQFYTWFTCVQLTNITSASAISCLHPIVVMLAGVLIFKKNPGLKAVLAIFAALIGGIIIIGGNINILGESTTEFIGNMVALLCAVLFGLYLVAGDYVRKTLDNGSYVVLMTAFCWLFSLILNLVSGEKLTGYSFSAYAYTFLIALCCQLGTHGLFNYCMARMGALYVSTWDTCEPVFATLVALVFIRQIPSLNEIVGCIITVVALLLYSKFEAENEEKAAKAAQINN